MATKASRESAWRIDPCALGGALAMRQEGFTIKEIEAVFGYVPPIDMDRETALAIMEEDLAAEEEELAGVGDSENI